MACGSPAVDTDVQITLEHQLDGQGIQVWGTTNLPDGAVLIVQATEAKGLDLRAAAENVKVRDGKYDTYLNLVQVDVRPGPIRLYVGFMIYNQPDFVVRAFGKKGERMEGTIVRSYPVLGEKKAEVVETVYWGEP